MTAMGCACAAAVAPLAAAAHRQFATGPLGLQPGRVTGGLRRSSLGMAAAVANARSAECPRRAFLGVRATAIKPRDFARQDVEVKDALDCGDGGGFYEKAMLAAAVALAPLVDVEAASAVQGEFGILEGRTFALIHPIVMGSLLAFTLYAGFLGWQWRRVRTIQTDISELKKQVKPVAVAAGEKSGSSPPPSPIEAKIDSLTEERKELVKGGYRDRHFNAGSILLGLGVFSAVGGCVNTWFRTGKLFPGPHLFAGAGITICWALAASCVPSMQKGSETARNLHISLNLINVFLFISQVPTGLEIVGKVFEFTTWP